MIAWCMCGCVHVHGCIGICIGACRPGHIWALPGLFWIMCTHITRTRCEDVWSPAYSICVHRRMYSVQCSDKIHFLQLHIKCSYAWVGRTKEREEGGGSKSIDIAIAIQGVMQSSNYFQIKMQCLYPYLKCVAPLLDRYWKQIDQYNCMCIHHKSILNWAPDALAGLRGCVRMWMHGSTHKYHTTPPQELAFHHTVSTGFWAIWCLGHWVAWCGQSAVNIIGVRTGGGSTRGMCPPKFS